MNIKYSDLYSDSAIKKIDDNFIDFLSKEDNELKNIVEHYRNHKIPEFPSEILIKLASKIEEFIFSIFNNKIFQNSPSDKKEYLNKVHEVRRVFIQRNVLRKFSKEDVTINSNLVQNAKKLLNDDLYRYLDIYSKNKNSYEDRIEAIDQEFITRLENTAKDDKEYNILSAYAAHRVYFGPRSNLFTKPEKVNYQNLIEYKREKNIVYDSTKDTHFLGKNKEFFEAKYCIKCHKTEKDSCRKGLEDKFGNIQKNHLNNELYGCPLGIKISEMNELYENFQIVAALSIITLDDPMVCLTGKRICNDCSKACIFQKQDSVDIPSIESRILKEVLNLEYGFEIYSLLLKWQALDPIFYLSKTNNSSSILVVGSGPAGIALSHYLTREGCNVTMIDAQKIEPIPEKIKKTLIKDYKEIKDTYNSIKPQGFGGVAEYGITDRWNKENLIVARLILERLNNFELIGSVKFGSTITYEDAKDSGYDHIALCCGSGYPKITKMNQLPANVRTASDFLMALGSGGAHFKDSNTNFMIHLPAIVIGAGLTAIDAATEITKYYPLLAKKIYKYFKDKNLDTLGKKEKIEASRLIYAGRLYEEEDKLALQEDRRPNYQKITDKLGGVYILYRRNINESPSYRLGHEEVQDCLKHGVKIIENCDFQKIEEDEFGMCSSITISKGNIASKIDAKTVFFATGTSSFTPEDVGILTSENKQKFCNENLNYTDCKNISIFGDMDIKYTGSVVKALASVKNNYKKYIIENLSLMHDGKINSSHSNASIELISKKRNFYNSLNAEQNLSNLLKSKIKYVKKHKNFTEIRVENPAISKKFLPGQFFKLENYRSKYNHSFEPIALSGCFSDQNYISFIIKGNGASTKLASKLSEGENISILGPLGKSYKDYYNSRIVIIGSEFRIFPFYDFVKKSNLKGNKVDAIFSMEDLDDLLYPEQIIPYLNKLTICNPYPDERLKKASYLKDLNKKLFFRNNLEEAIKELNLALYSANFYNLTNEELIKIEKIIREKSNSEKFSCSKNSTEQYAHIYSPMQCMIGGICGQCIIPLDRSKTTNKDIFSCRHQIQKLNISTTNILQKRLLQNSLLELISK